MYKFEINVDCYGPPITILTQSPGVNEIGDYIHFGSHDEDTLFVINKSTMNYYTRTRVSIEEGEANVA